jgi:hypothetical protein
MDPIENLYNMQYIVFINKCNRLFPIFFYDNVFTYFDNNNVAYLPYDMIQFIESEIAIANKNREIALYFKDNIIRQDVLYKRILIENNIIFVPFDEYMESFIKYKINTILEKLKKLGLEYVKIYTISKMNGKTIKWEEEKKFQYNPIEYNFKYEHIKEDYLLDNIMMKRTFNLLTCTETTYQTTIYSMDGMEKKLFDLSRNNGLLLTTQYNEKDSIDMNIMIRFYNVLRYDCIDGGNINIDISGFKVLQKIENNRIIKLKKFMRKFLEKEYPDFFNKYYHYIEKYFTEKELENILNYYSSDWEQFSLFINIMIHGKHDIVTIYKQNNPIIQRFMFHCYMMHYIARYQEETIQCIISTQTKPITSIMINSMYKSYQYKFGLAFSYKNNKLITNPSIYNPGKINSIIRKHMIKTGYINMDNKPNSLFTTLRNIIGNDRITIQQNNMLFSLSQNIINNLPYKKESMIDRIESIVVDHIITLNILKNININRMDIENKIKEMRDVDKYIMNYCMYGVYITYEDMIKFCKN